MRLVLDTHALIWWMTDPDQLSRRARLAIAAPTNVPYVSAITAYEIELKRSRDPLLGKLPLDLEDAVLEAGFMWLSITPGDCVVAGRLPLHHRDPWDRLLIAQSMRAGMVIISADERFPAYNAPMIW
jgi:PIN domain nuclease of toxin-antitoxin system